jgi:hypothetical protein
MRCNNISKINNSLLMVALFSAQIDVVYSTRAMQTFFTLNLGRRTPAGVDHNFAKEECWCVVRPIPAP